MYALVDCNNFFASCERVFRPDLRGMPVVVLSNNDGCVIARSNEAKELGIKMGEPFFKIKGMCQQRKVNVFSSNYTLYGDLSERVMSTIQDAWDDTEIYSIDEAFLDMGSMPLAMIEPFCWDLQKRVLKHTGIPVSIGIGKTKTLAKAANHIAKKVLKSPIFSMPNTICWLKKLEVGEIWGVGRQWQKKLITQQIHTAYDLASTDARLIGKKYNVMLQRTVLELQGIPCMALEVIEKSKSILSSRSFGSLQTEYIALRESVSYHSNIAWEKLRKQELKVKHLCVFIRSNRFREDLAQYSNSFSIELPHSTDDIKIITKYAAFCLRKIYKQGIQYKKCGVLFSDLCDKSHQQYDMFSQPTEEALTQSEKTMNAIEAINGKYGTRTIHLAVEGLQKKWSMRSELRTPSYTTRWTDIPTAYAKY